MRVIIIVFEMCFVLPLFLIFSLSRSLSPLSLTRDRFEIALQILFSFQLDFILLLFTT